MAGKLESIEIEKIQNAHHGNSLVLQSLSTKDTQSGGDTSMSNFKMD